MQHQPDKPAAWKGLNVAFIVAAGLMCLVAASTAHADVSCSLHGRSIGALDCHGERGQAEFNQPMVALAPDSDTIDFWAFVLPGAYAFSQNTLLVPARLLLPREPGLRTEISGPPIYRIAPKNSDPSQLPG